MELINPMIYVALVHKLTEEKNWNLIRKQFALFQQSSNVECCSIPRGLFTYAEKNAILNWWETFEQRSIALSLEYQYMGKTDISDCYGAIYTHSIAWALHGKSVAKNNKSQTLLGNYIDSRLQDMHSRQTVGIPQGSVLSDVIAEMVLGYADLLLARELENDSRLKGCEYRILRYRDDYRIFATSREGVHSILLALMEVLSGLNFKLGAAKTSISDDVVLDSVKPDKIEWLLRGYDRMNVHKKLLALSRFARDYPHSGTIVRELQKLSNYLDFAIHFT
jgi:magnesium/nickel/cobalt transporter corA